jgi:hypothetical protein
MAWEVFSPKGTLKADNQEFISISKSHFRFSSAFISKAKLSNSQFVRISVDQELFHIKFEFFKDKNENCLTLTHPKDSNYRQCSISSFLTKFKWVNAIAGHRKNKLRQFIPKSIGSNWIIELSPSFEQIVKRENASKIPENSKGIYRYKRSNSNEIVYIGKGDINKRLKEIQRKDWDFDIIEYSLINDEQEQFKWESHWLTKYEDEYKKKPFYNEIGGKRIN